MKFAVVIGETVAGDDGLGLELVNDLIPYLAMKCADPRIWIDCKSDARILVDLVRAQPSSVEEVQLGTGLETGKMVFGIVKGWGTVSSLM